MPKFPDEPKGYAVNNTTLLSAAGLFVFGLAGLVAVINAAVRLFASAWMYAYEGSSAASAGTAFIFAIVCFVAAILCRRGFRRCLSRLKQHRITN